jgi:hypothetical protein
MVHGVGVGARRATTSLEIREKKISVDSTRELVRSYFPPFFLSTIASASASSCIIASGTMSIIGYWNRAPQLLKISAAAPWCGGGNQWLEELSVHLFLCAN